ncbi:DUF2726 domain-containing protein [Undibacterium jejuense]
MKTVIIFLIAFVLALIVGRLFKKTQRPTNNQQVWPYYVKRPMGAAEQVLYFRLIKALPDYIVLAQVNMARVLNIKPSADFHEWNNRINRLSFDFVVCNRDFSVVAAIELDDASQHNFYQQDADAKKNKACKDAELRLIRWHVKLLPEEEAIQAAFSEHLITKTSLPDPAHDEQFDQMLSSVG